MKYLILVTIFFLGGCHVTQPQRTWSYVYGDLYEDFISQDYIVNCIIRPDKDTITIKDKGGYYVTDTEVTSTLLQEIQKLNKGVCNYR